MKRKNGFTLIELLAVIVVLAIIALIATPIVMNTIKNSKKGAAERTADNYVEQVEISLMTYRLEHGENLPDGEYTIDSNGNLVDQGKTLTIEMNGTKPSSGTIVIENGQVKKDGTTMKVGDYDVSYNSTNKTFVASESTGNNIEVLCKAVTELSTQNYFNLESYDFIEEKTGVLASEAGPYAYGVEYTCELGDNDSKTFYVLENNTDTVSLIMNMNIDSEGKGTTSGNTVAWCTKEDYIAAGGDINEWENNGLDTSGNNSLGPITALAYLESSTSGWTKLNPNQITLPTGQQIATAGGDTAWTDSNYTGSKLSSYLNENLNSDGGYYTSDSTPTYKSGSWLVFFAGFLNNNINWIADSHTFGVRPVITISKSQLG